MEFNDILKIEKNNSYIIGLTSELKALYVYNYYKKYKQSIVVVCNTLYESNMFFQSLNNYTEDVLFFPMDDFLTSQALAISPELKNTRLETIDELSNNNRKIVVTNLMGFLRFLPTKEIYQNNSVYIKVNEEYDMKELLIRFHRMGYIRE